MQPGPRRRIDARPWALARQSGLGRSGPTATPKAPAQPLDHRVLHARESGAAVQKNCRLPRYASSPRILAAKIARRLPLVSSRASRGDTNCVRSCRRASSSSPRRKHLPSAPLVTRSRAGLQARARSGLRIEQVRFQRARRSNGSETRLARGLRRSVERGQVQGSRVRRQMRGLRPRSGRVSCGAAGRTLAEAASLQE